MGLAKISLPNVKVHYVPHGGNTVFRGIIFVAIYFGTQKVFREGLCDYLFCRRRKHEEVSMESFTRLDDILED